MDVGIDPTWTSYIYLIAGGLSLVILCVITLFIARHYARKRAVLRGGKDAHVTLMITVPKFVTEEDIRTEGTTEQIQEDISITETFFSAIGGLKEQYGFGAWFYGRTDELALEIVAHKSLITFYLTLPVFLREFTEQQLHAQFPDAAIEMVEDFNIFSPTGTIVGGYLVFKRENALPIKTYVELESDPLNALTNTLSKVQETDGVAIQYVVRSAKPSWRSFGKKIVKYMQKGMTFEQAKKAGGVTWKQALQSKEASEKEKQNITERKISPAEEKMLEGIQNKASKAGLDVNIRILVSSESPAAAQASLNNVMQAFSQYNIYEYGNAFSHSIPSNKKKLIHNFIYRHFDRKFGVVMNSQELASLWHLPLPSTETPNIRWMLARSAPVPNEVPREGDLHLGYNIYRGTRTEVYTNDEDRRRHSYMIGKTGSGKSYFLRYQILQDIRAGKGVAVIDPHGDLVDAILGSIPKERIDDVVYFNPSDTDRPMGLNMLEAPDENMRDFAVQEMISIFYMLFPPEMIGPMFEHYMRNFMLTLMADLENPGTIVEIPRMISDAEFQKKWISKVKDPVVRSFWEDEMANTSDYHKSETMGYLVSKVGRFVENAMMRNIIGQNKSAFDFREIMDEGKILLVNLSKGQTGEVNANLIGLILVAKLQMAAFTRANIPEDQRRDFFLYIDEFQNFITPSIATILSEARKYKLNLVLAHQYMGQLVKDGKPEIRDAVLGNVGNMYVARVGPEDTEVLGKVFEPTFSPYDLMNTDKFTWNVKLIVGNAQIKPFTLKTSAPEKPNPKLFDALKEISRLTYGRPRDLVEREIAIRAGIGASKPTTPQVPPMTN